MTTVNDYADNTEDIGLHRGVGLGTRHQVVLLLDTSHSMGEPPTKIADMNHKLSEWIEVLKSGSILGDTIDLALITFGKDGVRIRDTRSERDDAPSSDAFTSVQRFKLPELSAGGVTPAVAAILTAIEVIDIRKSQLREQGFPYYRPMIWMITDGEPTDDAGHKIGVEGIGPISTALRAAEEGHHLLFYAIGVPGANEEVLRQLGGEHGWRLLAKTDWAEIFTQVSNSTGAVAGGGSVAEIKRRATASLSDQVMQYWKSPA